MHEDGKWRRWAPIVLLCFWLVDASAEESPRFPIAGYDVSGADVLPADEVARALQGFTGPAGSFETIQQAVEALQKLLVDRGYASARVFLPEQEVENGRIRLRVVVAVVGTLEVEGNAHHDADNVRNSVPALQPGVVPDMTAIANALRVANENPSKRTQLVFRQLKTEGQVGAVLRVADESPLRAGVTLDNTGSQATGSLRAGVLVQNSNLFNSDHALSAQVITSPTHADQVLMVGVGYRMPLYGIGDSMDFALGYSNVDSGAIASVGGNFNVSGSGRIGSIRYNHYLPRFGEVEQKAILGIDQRRYSSAVQLTGTEDDLVPDITVSPVSLAYLPVFRLDWIEGSGSLSYARNIPGAPRGERSDFAQIGVRQGANPDYWLIRYSGNLTVRGFGDWQLRAALNGQWTRDLLVSGEQFGLGGAESVRGFSERALAKDSGIRGSGEIVTPDLARGMGMDSFALRLSLFGDAGMARQNEPLPGEVETERIGSFGIGVNLTIGRSVMARLDAAQVKYGDGVTQPGAHRLHGQLIVLF